MHLGHLGSFVQSRMLHVELERALVECELARASQLTL